MPQETERKFLISSEDYKSEAKKKERIIQAYLCKAAERTVRIRIKNRKGYITIKGKSNESGLSRYEWEKEIPVSEAEELLQLCEPVIIDKTRYEIPYESHVFEVDEFHGENEGLVIAEIELESESENFKRPHWLGEEVTNIKKYYNSQLSKTPYRLWK